MKNLFPILAAALILTGCSTNAEEAEPTENTTSESTSSAGSSTSSSATQSSERPSSKETESAEPQSPVSADQLTVAQQNINGHGVYLNPDNGSYYYCNTTQVTLGNVAPGVCDGPYDYNGANQKFRAVAEEWYSQKAEESGMEDTTLPTGNATTNGYPDSPEDAVFNSCWENGFAQFTDGSVRPYPDCALKQTEARTPSPWVQGQIDWHNCIESGKSEEECRAERS